MTKKVSAMAVNRPMTLTFFVLHVQDRWETKKSGRQFWWSHPWDTTLVVLAKKREASTIFRIITAVDPHAFVSQTLASGVFGYGFDRIKVKANAEQKQRAEMEKLKAKVATDQANSRR